MLAYGCWQEEMVLRLVPHRQYLFTLPKCLRPHFYLRYQLSELRRLVGDMLNAA